MWNFDLGAHTICGSIYSFKIGPDIERLNLGFGAHTDGITIEVELTLDKEIRKGQLEDVRIKAIKELIEADRAPDYTEDEQENVVPNEDMCARCPIFAWFWRKHMIQLTRFTKAVLTIMIY